MAGSLMLALFLNLTVLEKANAEPAPDLSSIAPGCALPGEKVSLEGHGFGARNVKVSVAGIEARIEQTTGNRVDFLVPSEAPPGLTQVTATNPRGQTGSIDFQVKHAEICANHFDDDCDAVIDELDECPVTTLSIAAPTELNLETGKTAPFTTTLDFTSTSTSVPFTIQVTETVDPPIVLGHEGLTLSPRIDGEILNVTASTVNAYAQTLSAHEVGSYTITTIATLVETGQSQSTVTRVIVRPSVEPEEASLHFEIFYDNDPVPVGDPSGWTVDFGFSPQDKTKPYTVRFEQIVTPSQGLSFDPPLDGKALDVTKGWHEDLTQRFVSTQEGEYDVITTATVVETGYSRTVRNEVRLAAAGSPNISVVGPEFVEYFAFPTDLVTEVHSSVHISGRDADKVEGVTVEERRTGRQWTFTEDRRGKFGGQIEIDTRGMAPDDCFSFRAIVHTSKGDRVWDYQDYCVTGLPLDTFHVTSEEVERGFTMADGTQFPKDLIEVTFKSGVPESRMREIVAALGGTIIGARPDDKYVQIRLVPAPQSLRELLTLTHRLAQKSEVRSLYLPHFIDGGLQSLQTSDPESALQPHLKQIRVNQAWYLERGQGQIIAVLDTGVDLGHPDLSDKIWRDPDGLIGSGYDYGDDDPLPVDLHGHGTHVAGIAAGATDNGQGIAGIGWDTKILPVKITKGNSRIFLKDPAVNALKGLWRFNAPENIDHVKIVNFSAGASLRHLGKTCQAFAESGLIPFEWCSLYDPSDEEKLKFMGEVAELCRAVARSVYDKNIFFVAGAGNIGHEEKHYPAACAGAVAVAAVDGEGNKASFSEYGDWISLAAPGVDIFSTLPWVGSPGCTDARCNYGTKFGTSQASPMVAGTAALVLSQNPDMKPDEILKRLQQTAKKIESFYALGAGLLDVFGAVFNPSFEAEFDPLEADSLAGWEHFTCVPNVLTLESDRDDENECTPTDGSSVLKTILGGGLDIGKPTHGKQMAHLTTLPRRKNSE